MKSPSDYERAPSEASIFHGMACYFLTWLGFELVNDTTQFFGPFNVSFATYRSSQGLFLSAGFEPGDSNSAGFFCGRQWCHQGLSLCMSHRFDVLAKRFDIDLPLDYKLGYVEEQKVTMQTMLADLKRGLPMIVKRVTLDDLLAIEREQYGAEDLACIRFGPTYRDHVEISAFPA